MRIASLPVFVVEGGDGGGYTVFSLAVRISACLKELLIATSCLVGKIYTVDPIYRGAWGPSSATAIYPDRDISWGGSLLRRR